MQSWENSPSSFSFALFAGPVPAWTFTTSSGEQVGSTTVETCSGSAGGATKGSTPADGTTSIVASASPLSAMLTTRITTPSFWPPCEGSGTWDTTLNRTLTELFGFGRGTDSLWS